MYTFKEMSDINALMSQDKVHRILLTNQSFYAAD